MDTQAAVQAKAGESGRRCLADAEADLKIWPVVPHAWQLAYPTVPEARQSIHEASAFLNAAVIARQAAGVRS
jgi:hypothetical protein